MGKFVRLFYTHIILYLEVYIDVLSHVHALFRVVASARPRLPLFFSTSHALFVCFTFDRFDEKALARRRTGNQENGMLLSYIRQQRESFIFVVVSHH